MVAMGAALAIELWRAAGLIQASPERLGGIGVLIGVLEFALGKIGVLEFAAIGMPSWASIGANGMHDYPLYPIEVLNRAADIFMMAGHMLGQRLLLFLLRLGLVVSLVNDDPQPFPRRRD